MEHKIIAKSINLLQEIKMWREADFNGEASFVASWHATKLPYNVQMEIVFPEYLIT